MDLIIGGAYQGKLDYARTAYGLRERDICDCGLSAVDFSRRCLYHYEKYILACLRRGETPRLPSRADAVVIAEDIFCGVVPTDGETRAWRESAGRTLTALAQSARCVTRLFCGIPMRLKE